MVRYKQLCSRCKKERVITSSGTKFPLSYDCQKDELKGEIKDPEMKKLFDIPEDFYKESSFLRSIKINYLKFEKLSDKQIEWFKKVVDEMKNKKTNTEKST